MGLTASLASIVVGPPAKILSPYLCTALLQYFPKIKNALHNETVILNYIGGDPISHSLSN